MLGTMRENNVDKSSKNTVGASIARLQNAPRGSWEFIAIVEQEAGYTKRKAAHAKAQRTIPKNLRTLFPQPVMGLFPVHRLHCLQGQKYRFVLHQRPPEDSCKTCYEPG
ncbi:unnamed protein product [Phytophthora fragariaefolia]|uniref:Unnamed protein product n=1 Tax=Phytophthora fragariaefolia TaxID=1490495 RepID=A0A9W6XAY9_9STRA|nr:unnamed protein product [Phytophthora fragariaefolia]